MEWPPERQTSLGVIACRVLQCFTYQIKVHSVIHLRWPRSPHPSLKTEVIEHHTFPEDRRRTEWQQHWERPGKDERCLDVSTVLLLRGWSVYAHVSGWLFVVFYNSHSIFIFIPSRGILNKWQSTIPLLHICFYHQPRKAWQQDCFHFLTLNITLGMMSMNRRKLYVEL